MRPALTIIHFNDVYDIQPKGGSMGVCNFKAKVEQLREQFPQALTLFSGDCMSPSTLTNIKEGWQMVHALNALGVDCACFGNHEFDFDSDHTLKLVAATNFPWLLGNIHYLNSSDLLGGGRPYRVLHHQGLKIGILGVAGEDWIGILSDEYENMLEYEDCYVFSQRTAKHLREEERCDIVIALTHMRNNADREFPRRVEGVDLVLGGHDHVIMEELIEGTAVIKSGSNFNNVGLIHLLPKTPKVPGARRGRRWDYDWTIFKVPAASSVDQQLKKYVDDLMEEYSKFDEVIGYTDVDLEMRFTKIRTEESNYGNFLADLTRLYYDSNIAVINSGMVRNDTVIAPGRLTYSKASNIINSPMVVKKLSGKAILDMLEYSVKEYPGFAGQFLFVSGLRFSFDPTATPRVREVTVGRYPLDLHQDYTVTTTLYQAKGGDGFEMLRSGEMIVDEVKGISMLNLLLKFFKAPDSHQEYESIKILSQEPISAEDPVLPSFPEEHLILVRKPSVRLGRIKELRSRFVLNEEGKKLTSIAPECDGRILCLVKQQDSQ